MKQALFVKPRAAIYVRVSTTEQAEEGVSLAAQEERLRAYCALRGLEVAHVVSDPAQSGFKALVKRPGGRVLLDLVRRKQIDAVVVFKLDRAFRNAGDCLAVVEAWDRAAVALHLIDLGGQAVDTSSAMGKFFLTVMAGAAELERNQIAERTALALAHMSAKGQRIGAHAPIGYRHDGGALVEDDAEQAMLRAVRALRASGGTIRGIAGELTQNGFKSRSGSAFAPVQISRMLAGPKRLRAA